LVRAGAL